MYRAFLPVEPDEVRELRPETTPPRPRRLLARVVFSVVVVVGLLGVIQLLSRSSGGSPCSDQQQAAWDAIDHFAALAPGDGQLPGCAASFETDADARTVLDHYQDTLVAQGWTITSRQDPTAGLPTPTPPTSDDPSALAVPRLNGSLVAERDGLELLVDQDVGWAIRGKDADLLLVGTVYVVLSERQ